MINLTKIETSLRYDMYHDLSADVMCSSNFGVDFLIKNLIIRDEIDLLYRYSIIMLVRRILGFYRPGIEEAINFDLIRMLGKL